MRTNGTASRVVVEAPWFAESGEALILYEPKGRQVVDANSSALRLAGYASEAIRALTLDGLLMGPAAASESLTRLSGVGWEGGLVRAPEGVFLRRAAGPPLEVRLSASRARGGPEPLGLVALAAALSSCSAAAASLEDDTLETFFRLSPSLCCVASLDGKLLRVNRPWEDCLGYTADELLLGPITRFVHPDDRNLFTPDALAKASGWFEARFIGRDGVVRRLDWRATLSGGLLHGIAREVTPTAPRSSTAPGPLFGARVLVAEDNRDNQRVVTLRLTMAGAQVTLAPNGRVAIDHALAARDAKRPFDLVLMDMQMPVLDGYEATRLLRSEGFLTPIVAVTAHATPEDRLECLRFGCDDHLAKPVDWPALFSLLNSLLLANAT